MESRTGSTSNPPEKEIQTELKASSFPDWYLVERSSEVVCHSPTGDLDASFSTAYESLTPTGTPTRKPESSVAITHVALMGTPIADDVPSHQPQTHLPPSGRGEAKPPNFDMKELQDAIHSPQWKYHQFQAPRSCISSPNESEEEDSQSFMSTHSCARTMSSAVDLTDAVDLTNSVTVNEEVMGQGGYASVYMGSWEGKPVALKALHVMLTDKLPTCERRLRRETLVLSMLKHPNITPLYGVATTSLSQLPAIVTPWYFHGSADKYLAHRDPLKMAERVKLSMDVASGLQYLHSLNIVHGDLKPGNILIDDMGNARLCDFGLSSLLGEQAGSGFTTTTEHIGTARYSAPEIFDRPVDAVGYNPTPASDIFSLGCVMYEFTTSKLPYPHLGPSQRLGLQILAHILRRLPPARRSQDLDKLDSKCRASQLWCLLDRCWDYNPTRRPSALQVEGELASIRTIEIDYNDCH